MRNVSDSFLRFLADNLTDVTVHAIRKDPDNPSSSVMQMNALNVGFGRVDLGVSLSTMIVKMDVIADSQLTAMDIVQSLWLLLSARFYTPLLDYSVDPASPTDTGTMLVWRRVRFVPVDNDQYAQYSATLGVQYHNESASLT